MSTKYALGALWKRVQPPESAMSKKIGNVFEDGSEREVDAMLAFFFYECSTNMIPSHDQVHEWGRILAQRGPEFAGHAAACLRWPDE